MILRPGDTWIYAIEAVGLDLVKIGRANDVKSRMRELQVGAPVELRLLASRVAIWSDEGALHRRFEKSWRRGEWFSLNEIRDDLLDYFFIAHRVDEETFRVMCEFGRKEDEPAVALRRVPSRWFTTDYK